MANGPEGASAAGSVSAAAHSRAEPFGERLASRVAERASQLVLGLDPDPARLWPAGQAAAPPRQGEGSGHVGCWK